MVHQILQKAPLALNLSCVSVFNDTEEARIVSLGSIELKRENVGKETIFDLSVPFPYLLETTPAPWFSHTQILKSGVGPGIGTANPEVYKLLLDGIDMLSFYNKFIVQRPEKTDYTDDAMNVKKIILKLAFMKKNPFFETVRLSGIMWANLGFEYLLCGALDEAYCMEKLESVKQSLEVDKESLLFMLGPIIWYNRVHNAFNLKVLPFRDLYERIALFCCLIFAVQHKYAPWRQTRETQNDPETAALFQTLLPLLKKHSDFSDGILKIEENANLFVQMVKINDSVPKQIDVCEKLYRWAEENGAASITRSRSAPLFSQP